MWKTPKAHKPLVTLIFYPEELICCFITPANHHATFLLKAYERIPLNHHACIQGKLFNITFIYKSIKNFLKKHNIHQPATIVSLNGNHIVQAIADTSSAIPEIADFRLPILHSLVWDHRYLYQKDNGLFSFYLAGIPQSILFQYTALLHMNALHPLLITTDLMAHIALYRFIYGNNFRTTQFGIDMQSLDNHLIHHFSFDMLCRILHIDHRLIQPHKDSSPLFTSVGLHLLGQQLHETD